VEPGKTKKEVRSYAILGLGLITKGLLICLAMAAFAIVAEVVATAIAHGLDFTQAAKLAMLFTGWLFFDKMLQYLAEIRVMLIQQAMVEAFMSEGGSEQPGEEEE
jgi:hypothetical protein